MRVETFGSLFSGIAGLDVGLEAAGLTPRWCAEIDPFCGELLAARRPDVPNLGDVRTVAGSGPERVDLVAGGFPCQPVSDAGRRRGTSDERWLWPAMRDVVAAVEPSVVLIENVPGLLRPWTEPKPDALAELEATAAYQAASRRDRGKLVAALPTLRNPAPMGEVIGGLADLGYAAEWDLIPAAAVGAPHLRFRVFIVAWADGRIRNLFGPSSRATLDESWPAEPSIPRLLRVVARRRERLTALGNAVVPKVGAWVGGRIAALADAPDDLLWGWPVAERNGGWTCRGVKGVAKGQPFLSSWPKAGYLLDGVASGDSPTIDRGLRARWKTPTSAPWSGGGCGGPLQMDVAEAERGRIWPTPNASQANYGEDIDAWETRRAAAQERLGNGNGYGEPLGIAVQRAERDRPLLPTPQAADGDRSSEQGVRHYSEGGGDNPTLLGAARRLEREMLPTPSASDGAGGRISPAETRASGLRPSGSKAQRTLRDAATDLPPERFPTPTASDARGSRRATARTEEWESNEGTTLLDHARLNPGREMVPTPTATDYKTVTTRGQRRGQLEERVRDRDGLWPTPKASPSGPDYAREGREESGSDDLATAAARAESETAGGLNPEWVEWLMGFPPGWTDLDA